MVGSRAVLRLGGKRGVIPGRRYLGDVSEGGARLEQRPYSVCRALPTRVNKRKHGPMQHRAMRRWVYSQYRLGFEALQQLGLKALAFRLLTRVGNVWHTEYGRCSNLAPPSGTSPKHHLPDIAPRLPSIRITAHCPIGAITPEQRIVTARQIRRRRCKRRSHV